MYVLMIQYITDGNKTAQFNGEMTVSLKISLFWKLLLENMIVLANTNLLMTKSTIPVTLKERWCYDNVDATTAVGVCTFGFWKISLTIQFVFRTSNLSQTSTKLRLCRIPTADLWTSPSKIHVNGNNFIDLRCRKFIIQNITFADQLFWNTY